MVGLLDIAPVVEPVIVGDVTIECRGISLKGIVSLIQRFPSLQTALLSATELGGPSATSDAGSLMTEAPDAIAAILVAGTGPGRSAGIVRQAEEDHAADLPVETQIDLLTAILKATMPNGLSPLVEKLTAMFGAVGSPNLQAIGFDASRPPRPNGVAPTNDSQLPLNV